MLPYEWDDHVLIDHQCVGIKTFAYQCDDNLDWCLVGQGSDGRMKKLPATDPDRRRQPPRRSTRGQRRRPFMKPAECDSLHSCRFPATLVTSVGLTSDKEARVSGKRKIKVEREEAKVVKYTHMF
jgi:hypothetical protein